MTIVVNLQTGRIIHAVKGKNKEAVLPFLKKLSKKSKKLKAAAIDMGKAYFSAVIEVPPHVDIVFDHFRRQLRQELDKAGMQTLKGSRYLLLSNFKNLGSDRRNRLCSLLEINEPLFVMHSMKEQLRLFWKHKDKKSAGEFLSVWCKTDMEYRVHPANGYLT